MNFLEALGLTTIGFVMLGIWWWVESSGRVRIRGRLGGVPYLIILAGVYFMIASIWTGVSSFFTASTPTHIPTRVVSSSPTNTPNAISSAQQTAQASDCINWETVTPNMIGRVKCIYGTVNKTRFVGESTFQILFSSNPEHFFLAGGTYNYGVVSGDCVLAEGEILKSSVGVPYINIDEALYKCESWMK
jgi:hypothetical protein